MHNSQSPSPQLGKSTYSSGAARRQILWNVVQPGDPYDIRKSMIARLPGGNQHFMGDKLEVVCLLQSAQIERLCEFLDDYKFRFRQIQRRQLDRHSYQIQIKQLTQQLVDENSVRGENTKLKEFIKKLQIQIQQLKSNRYNVDNNLRANYQSALVQIETLMSQINMFKSERQKYMIQINNYSARIEALQATKQREMKQLFNKYADQNKFAIENETRSIKTRYESEINRLQFEIKRLKQFNDSKNQQINELNSKNRSLLIKIQQLQSKKGKADPAHIAQMQNRFVLMGQQIQRLNLRIKQSTAKIDECSRNELYWKDKYNRLQEQYRSIQIRYKQVNEQYKLISIKLQKSQTNNQSKYQDQISKLNAELKRLQNQRMTQSQKYFNLEKKYNEIQYNYSRISVIERQNAQLKLNAGNVQQLKRRIAQYETKIAILSQQIQRLTAMSSNSGIQKKGFDDLKNDFEQFKRKSIEKQRSITQRYQSQMHRKVLQYESRLAKFAEQSGSEFQVRLQAINRQVEKLNIYLKQKTEQSQQNKRKIRQLQALISQKYQIEVQRTYASFESTIKQLKFNNDQLNRKLREFDNVNRKMAEYENKIALLSQQVQRLNYNLSSKNEQIQGLRRKLSQQKPAPPKPMQAQSSIKISILQESQFRLNQQNEDLRRRLQQVVQLKRVLQQFEMRIRTITQQNERLNSALKQKVELINRNQVNYRNALQQLQTLRRSKLQVQSSFSQRYQLQKMQNSRKFVNYEQSLSAIQRQYEQLRRKMMSLGNDSNRKVSEYENKIVLLTQQIQRLNQTFKIKINDYQNANKGLRNQLQLSRKQNRDLQINITQKFELQNSRNVKVYEQNMSGLTRELQQLRRRIKQYETMLHRKNEEVGQVQNRYRVILQQYESFKSKVKNFQGEVSVNISSYEQNIKRVSHQYEILKGRMPQYENKIALLSQENQRLNTIIRNNQMQLQNLRRGVNQMTQKYQLQTSRKISAYEQNLSFATKQKEDFRRKLSQYQNNIVNLQRQLEERNRRILEWQNKFRQMVQENEVINNKFRQLQITVSQKYQVQTSRKITAYEQNIQNQLRQIENMKMRITEYENRRINYQNQINRLNLTLKNSSQEHQKLMLRMRQSEKSQIQKYQIEVNRKYSIYEQNISNLNIQIQDFKRKFMNADQITKNQSGQLQELRRRLKQYGDVHRKVAEYENQFALIRQQLQRVNINLKNKIQQNNGLQNRLQLSVKQGQDFKRRVQQLEINVVKKYEIQFNNKSLAFEQNIANFKRQNDQLRRRLSQFQNKIVLLTQQIQRLNNMVRVKTDQLNQSELRGRNWQQQIQNSRRKLLQSQKSNTMRLQTQLSRTVSLYEQNIINVSRQFQSFKGQATRRIAEYETKIALLSQQLERSSQALRQKSDQVGQLDLKFRNSIQEIDRLQKSLRQLQMSSARRFDSQKTTIVSTYQQNILVISRQFQEYKNQSNRRFGDYENKIVLITRQLQRVNANLQKKVDDYNALQKAAKQFQQQIQLLNNQMRQNDMKFNQRFEFQLQKKVVNYEQNFSVIKGQIEGYDRKNKQLTRIIAQNETKIALLTQQIERLNQVLKTKVDEAKHYQAQVQKYVSQLDKLKLNISGYYTAQIQKLNSIIKQKNQQYLVLQQKLTQMQSGQDTQFKQLQSNFSLVTKQYENSKKHLQQYEQSIRKLYSQFQRLQVIINELKVERQTLFDKNHGLIKEVERLTAENKDQQSQLYEIRIKFSDEVSLQKRINQHMALMVVLFAEIQTLRQRVKDKQKQVQQVRRSSLAPLKA